jgi:hypothetical protein
MPRICALLALQVEPLQIGNELEKLQSGVGDFVAPQGKVPQIGERAEQVETGVCDLSEADSKGRQRRGQHQVFERGIGNLGTAEIQASGLFPGFERRDILVGDMFGVGEISLLDAGERRHLAPYPDP